MGKVRDKLMRISRKFVATLGLLTGLVTLGVPVRAHGDPIAPILGPVIEGQNTTLPDAFTITNPNNFAVTLSLLEAAVNGDNSVEWRHVDLQNQ
jgi:hypothetical protein